MIDGLLFIFAIGFLIGYWVAKKDSDTLRQQIRQLQADRSDGSVISQPTQQSNLGIATPPITNTANYAHPAAISAAQSSSSLYEEQLVTSQELRHPSVDNAVILLYLGAFLFMGSVGLFLAFSGVAGGLKAFAVALLVVLFYASGFFLYKNSLKLQPAGVAFLAIGMILMPFLGLAVHTYVFNSEAGVIVWMATSLAAIALYIHALVSTRQSYVSYFMLLAVLSAFMSGVAIVDLPVYYFAWTMTIVAILFIATIKLFKLWPDVRVSLEQTANSLVPISMLMAIVFSGSFGLGTLALTFGLSGFYYSLAAWIEQDRNQKIQYLAATDASIVASILTGLYARTNDFSILSVVAISIALAQLVALLFLALRPARSVWSGATVYIAGITSLLPFVAIICSLDNAPLLAAVIAAGIAIWVGLYVATRNGLYVIFAIIALLLLPPVIGLYVVTASWPAALFTLVYAVLAVFILFARRWVNDDKATYENVHAAFYIAIALVLLTALGEGAVFFGGVCFALSAAFVGLSYFEDASIRRMLFAGSLVLQIVGVNALVFGLVDSRQDQMFLYPLAMGIVGALQYIIALFGLPLSEKRLHYIRLAAMCSFGLGAISVLGYGETTMPMIVSLLLLSYTGYVEAEKEDSTQGKDIALALGMVSFQWLLYLIGLREFLVYTHLWALFFAVLGTARVTKSESNGYTTSALCFFTIPTALYALGDAGALYGWLLLIEHIALMLIGMVFSNTFVRRWGLWVSVGAVLYQLRNLQFIALGFLAIVLIIIAIRVLQKSEKSE